MGDWPFLGDVQRFESFGVDLVDTDGTDVASSGTAHTKGPYVQLIASTAFAASGVLLSIRSSISAADNLIIDLAIGGSGVEVDIVPNLLFDQFDTYMCLSVFFPISIPSGSRVSARCQADAADASEDISISGVLVGQSFLPSSPLSTVRAYGIDLANTVGTLVDPGGAASTKGPWAELAASVDKDIKAFVLIRGQRGNSTLAGAKFLYDIGVGAAGSEQVIVPNIFYTSSSGPDTMVPQVVGPLPIQVPAGSRLSMRGQSDITNITDRRADFVIYGIS